jgi:hypothetical protein
MSRSVSRTVPASARRAGRAVVVVSVCPAMMSPGSPSVTRASVAPRARKRTGCDDFSAGGSGRKSHDDFRKRIVMITHGDDRGMPDLTARLGAGGGQNSEAGCGRFSVGGGPGAALPTVDAPEQMAVGPGG